MGEEEQDATVLNGARCTLCTRARPAAKSVQQGFASTRLGQALDGPSKCGVNRHQPPPLPSLSCGLTPGSRSTIGNCPPRLSTDTPVGLTSLLSDLRPRHPSGATLEVFDPYRPFTAPPMTHSCSCSSKLVSFLASIKQISSAHGVFDRSQQTRFFILSSVAPCIS